LYCMMMHGFANFKIKVKINSVKCEMNLSNSLMAGVVKACLFRINVKKLAILLAQPYSHKLC